MQEKLGFFNKQSRIRNYDYRVMSVVHYSVESTCVPRHYLRKDFMFAFIREDGTDFEKWILERKSSYNYNFEIKGKDYIVVLHSNSIELKEIISHDIAKRIAVRTQLFTFDISAWLLE